MTALYDYADKIRIVSKLLKAPLQIPPALAYLTLPPVSVPLKVHPSCYLIELLLIQGLINRDIDYFTKIPSLKKS